MPATITRDELRRMLRDPDVQLVDVLPSAEFAEGHLPGAVNLPLKKLDRGTAAALDKSRPVVVY